MPRDLDADPDPLSLLQRIENELVLTEKVKSEVEAIKTELWFLGTFFRLNSTASHIRVKSFLLHLETLIGPDIEDNASFLLQRIKGFKLQIINSYWYSYPGTLRRTTPLTHEVVVEFVDMVVLNINGLQIDPKDGLSRSMEEVETELRALRSFTLFLGKMCNSEQQNCWQTFLRHVEFVATLAAILFYLNLGYLLSDLLEVQIKPIEPQVRVIYTDVLRYLKLSGTRNMSLIVAADGFVEALLHMFTGLRGVSSLATDQAETLHEQVKSLRISLNELLLISEIQDEMRIGFFRLLETVVIHSGLMVYSLCDRSKKDWDQELLVLCDKIKFVKTKICYDIRDWVQSYLPKNDALGFSNYLVDSLKELLSSNYASLALKNQLEVFHAELKFFQPFLKRVAEQGNSKHDKLQGFVARVIDKAYEVEYIVDSFAVRDVPLTYLTMWLSEIIREIELIKTELTKSLEKNVTSASHAANQELVGFEDVRKIIRGKLVGGLPGLDVISIVGMAGSGKSTLARSFINDDSTVSHFDFRAECRVSQEYTRRDLLLSILTSANYEPMELSKEADNELADRLRKILLTKRYLLIVDDVWEVKAWDDLKLCFRDARNGSRIILTTRHQKVAVYTKYVTEPHCLRPLREQESWLLLQKEVFGQEICPKELKEVGQNIAEKCNGLPLSIVLVAGLLAKMDKTERCWTQVEFSFGERIQDGAKDLVKLSYNDLPYKLKPCFLYFGAFLEDREISISKLTSLWIAEAFIENDVGKCLEDVAEDYLQDLIGRNLVMVSKKRSNGKIKACRVHDIMLEFCKEKAEQDNFLLWLKRDQDTNPPHFYSEKPVHRRLSFCSNCDDLAGWRPSYSHARSILFREISHNTCSSMGHASIIFGNFKFLRVLDLEFVNVKSFPTELNYLRYLAVQTADDSIPSSIENLWNLQTFIVRRNGGQVLLPDSFWKLSKLRNVRISDGALINSRGARESTGGSLSKLENLATLSSIYVSRADNMERIARRTPNLRKLRCTFADSGRWGKNENRFPVLDSLCQLETLKVVFIVVPKTGPSRLNFPTSLKKLTLCNFPLSLAEISTIATHLTLEVLKLQRVAFERDEWEVKDNEFPQLKFLKLENLSLSKWTASDEAFSCLEKLVLHRCLDLEAIPCCFEELGYLQYIEVKSCSEYVEDSARNVKETRVDNGNKCDVKFLS